MVEARSRHEFVALQLRQRIMQRQYAVGESLPSESMLCAEFEVSRGPVRQALATLKNEGLIQLSQGKPAVVRSHDITQTLDTFTPFSQWARRTGRVAGSRTLESHVAGCPNLPPAHWDRPRDDFVVEVLRVRLLDGEPTMIERSTFTDASAPCCSISTSTPDRSPITSPPAASASNRWSTCSTPSPRPGSTPRISASTPAARCFGNVGRRGIRTATRSSTRTIGTAPTSSPSAS